MNNILQKLLRGNILNIIYMAWQGEALNPDDPLACGKSVLVATMENLKILPSNQELKAGLRYLEAKGYVDVEWLQDGTGGFESVRLTAKGIDLVEGTLKDDGVMFTNRKGI